jgi:DNA gyrase subunit B
LVGHGSPGIGDRHRNHFPADPRASKTEVRLPSRHRLREEPLLNSGVTLVLSDLRGVEPKSLTLHFEGGLEAFVRYLDRSSRHCIPHRS